MKLLLRSRAAGNILVLSLIMAAVLGLTLTAYLQLVSSQSSASARSQAWNLAVGIAEAGVEEALTQINTTNNWSSNGWPLSDGQYTKTRILGDGYYEVGLSNPSAPVIISAGHMRLWPSSNYITRTIRVTAERDGLFIKAMVAKGTINMNGNRVQTDSFDSGNPTYSTGAKYDPAKAKDNGDVASNLRVAGAINLGNANVYGKTGTGPGGTISVGSNGGVGSRAWQGSHPGQIQPGWSSSDMNVAFPDVVVPFSSGTTPVSGTVAGQSYEYVLGRGDYVLSSLSLSGQKKLIVTNNARLLVNGSIGLAGQATIIIATNASLTLYANGPTDISGNGLVNNNICATNFFLYGTPNNTSITLSGNATLTGVIYAPNADFSLKGGGSTDQDFVGASVTKTVTMNGHFKFHYDEALARLGGSGTFQITSWNEL